MNQPPKVSIIIPAWNNAALLPATLRSIQEQTLTDWECIVVDDGSRDATLEVARQWARDDTRFQALTQKNAWRMHREESRLRKIPPWVRIRDLHGQ